MGPALLESGSPSLLHPVIHSCHKYVLSAFDVPGTLQSAGHTGGRKARSLFSGSRHSSRKGQEMTGNEKSDQTDGGSRTTKRELATVGTLEWTEGRAP